MVHTSVQRQVIDEYCIVVIAGPCSSSDPETLKMVSSQVSGALDGNPQWGPGPKPSSPKKLKQNVNFFQENVKNCKLRFIWEGQICLGPLTGLWGS